MPGKNAELSVRTTWGGNSGPKRPGLCRTLRWAYPPHSEMHMSRAFGLFVALTLTLLLSEPAQGQC